MQLKSQTEANNTAIVTEKQAITQLKFQKEANYTAKAIENG